MTVHYNEIRFNSFLIHSTSKLWEKACFRMHFVKWLLDAGFNQTPTQNWREDKRREETDNISLKIQFFQFQFFKTKGFKMSLTINSWTANQPQILPPGSLHQSADEDKSLHTCFYLWGSSSAAEPKDDGSQCLTHGEGNLCNTTDRQTDRKEDGQQN